MVFVLVLGIIRRHWSWCLELLDDIGPGAWNYYMVLVLVLGIIRRHWSWCLESLDGIGPGAWNY